MILIFEHHNEALHDESAIFKRKIYLVGVVNPQDGVFNRDKLPSSIIDWSIYHIVSNPNK